MLGLHGATRESAERTIDFAVESGVDYASFSSPLRGGEIEPAELEALRDRAFARLTKGCPGGPGR